MHRGFSFVNLAAIVLISIAAGCSQQNLTVPGHDEMVSEFQFDVNVSIQVKTKLIPLKSENDEMTIDERYWSGNTVPTRAFLRLESAGLVGDRKIELDPGTTIHVTKIEVYKNAHVYIGTLTSGPVTGGHVLYVAPTFSDGVNDRAQLLASDRLYIKPVVPADQKARIPVY